MSSAAVVIGALRVYIRFSVLVNASFSSDVHHLHIHIHIPPSQTEDIGTKQWKVIVGRSNKNFKEDGKLDLCSYTLNISVNIGIKHDFPCINVCQVPREMLKTEAEGRGFQQFLRDLGNVNARKIMFDRCYCINSITRLKK